MRLFAYWVRLEWNLGEWCAVRLPSPSSTGQRFRWKVVERCSFLLEWTHATPVARHDDTLHADNILHKYSLIQFHLEMVLSRKRFRPLIRCHQSENIRNNSSKLRDISSYFLRVSWDIYSIYDSMANANEIQKIKCFLHSNRSWSFKMHHCRENCE